MRGRWELSDAQWQLIELILQPKRRSDGRGRPWQETRAVLNGILWILGTGAQWRELPKKYPPGAHAGRRHRRSVLSGGFGRSTGRAAAQGRTLHGGWDMAGSLGVAQKLPASRSCGQG